jgi:hypothetical protein
LAIVLAWFGFSGHRDTLHNQTEPSLGLAWELDENRAMISMVTIPDADANRDRARLK